MALATLKARTRAVERYTVVEHWRADAIAEAVIVVVAVGTAHAVFNAEAQEACAAIARNGAHAARPHGSRRHASQRRRRPSGTRQCARLLFVAAAVRSQIARCSRDAALARRLGRRRITRMSATSSTGLRIAGAPRFRITGAPRLRPDSRHACLSDRAAVDHELIATGKRLARAQTQHQHPQTWFDRVVHRLPPTTMELYETASCSRELLACTGAPVGNVKSSYKP